MLLEYDLKYKTGSIIMCSSYLTDVMFVIDFRGDRWQYDTLFKKELLKN